MSTEADKVLTFKRILDESREFSIDEIERFTLEYRENNSINRKVSHLFSINENGEYLGDCVKHDKL